MKTFWRRTVFYLLLIGLWQAVYSAGIFDKTLFPSPAGVTGALVAGLRSGAFEVAIGASMERIAWGYSVSLVLGVSLGLLTARSRLAEDTIGSLLVGLQALPSICWLPLALLWFGLNELAIVFVVLVGTTVAIALATEGGVRAIPPLYARAARTMGVQGVRLWWEVILPAALPATLTGAKLGWAFAWRSLMAGELLFVSMGLGHLLMMGRELNDMNQVVAVMLVIVALGLMVDQMVFARLERRVRRAYGLARA